MTDKKDDQDKTGVDKENNLHDPSRRRFIKNTGMVVGGLAGGSLLGRFLLNPSQTQLENESVDEQTFMEARMFGPYRWRGDFRRRPKEVCC